VRRRAERLIRGTHAPEATLTADQEREAQTIAARIELRLPRLSKLFYLSPLAVDAVICLLAAEYDPFLRLVLRALQREQGRPWLELGTIAELLELATPRLPELAEEFAPVAPLRRWALADVEAGDVPAVSRRVKLVARVAEFLVGIDRLPDGMTRVEPRPGLQPLVAQPVFDRVLRRLQSALTARDALLLEVTGPHGCGRRYLAEALAHKLQLPLLVVDLATFARESLHATLVAGLRESWLGGALVCYANWDAHLDKEPLRPVETSAGESQPPPPARARRLPAGMDKFLAALDCIVMLTAEEREPALVLSSRPVVHADVRFPSPSQRAALVARNLDGVRVEPELDFVALARRYALDPARLGAGARAALELARERGDDDAVTAADLSEGCRRQLRHDLESVATRVTSSHIWEDLVVPVDVYYALQEMIAYVRHAEHVYDKWGFGGRHGLRQGVSALFAGPPGTGKTMCACVMARELDMELFQVDLSRVVSKWIGETEKNLAKIFDEAERSHAIILFDEADSLFARRTEVRSSVDRYANLEVNYLLQRMEAFAGITMLTTNFEDAIDTAFKRRLTFRVRFEKPDGDARAALWSKMFPASCELADDVSPQILGEKFEMSGGNIRNAAVRAAFLAAAEDRPIDMAMCLLAAERECREMGLLVKSERVPVEIGDQPTPPDRGFGSAPKLVPITHPRR
jgi:SpoVK/Ycf46/Vps4 family AAA+-type ATPase